MLRCTASRVWGFSLAALAALIVCGACGKNPGGETCKANSDCESGTCSLINRCAPGECECSGTECGTVRSSCAEGQVCVAGKPPLEVGYNRCRTSCSATKPCGAGTTCELGLCLPADTFALSWENIPRSAPCSAKIPCEFRLKTPSGVTVTTYAWTFGGAGNGPAETTDPVGSFTYDLPGTYDVRVTARTASGGTGTLTTTEVLCDGSIGDACDVNTSACCQGSCVRGLCK
jgi:hypothetical protein